MENVLVFYFAPALYLVTFETSFNKQVITDGS